MFCSRCGKELTGSPAFCVSCGARLVENRNISPKSRLATSLLAWYLGFSASTDSIWQDRDRHPDALDLWRPGIWTIIDFIVAVTGNMKDKEGRLIQKW